VAHKAYINFGDVVKWMVYISIALIAAQYFGIIKLEFLGSSGVAIETTTYKKVVTYPNITSGIYWQVVGIVILIILIAFVVKFKPWKYFERE